MSKTFPIIYDQLMKPLENGTFKIIRESLLSRAEGKVLEIGSGTGINFPFYKNVESVTAIEPNPHMTELSSKNSMIASVPIEIIQTGAEQLPFADDSFDTIVATLVFCSIPNVDMALDEVKRVCKPNGKLLFFEHIKMDNPVLAKMQNYLTPLWKRLCDGCCLNRETVSLVEEKGFQIVEIKKFYRGLFVIIEAKNI